MNNILRDRNIDKLTRHEYKRYSRHNRILSNAINDGPRMAKETTVYRAAEVMDPAWNHVGVGEFIPHTEFGFISTSCSVDAALNFVDDQAEYCLLNITLTPGSQFLYIGQASAFGPLGEDEIILQHRTRLYLVGRSHIVHAGTTMVVLHVTNSMNDCK